MLDCLPVPRKKLGQEAAVLLSKQGGGSSMNLYADLFFVMLGVLCSYFTMSFIEYIPHKYFLHKKTPKVF